MVNSIPNFDPSQMEYLQLVYSGDHGQKKLRMASKLLMKMIKEENERSIVYPIADVDCKKDTGEIFKNTIHESLREGINTVIESSVQFILNRDTKKWECKLVPEGSDESYSLEAFLCGDIKFLMMMLGREDFDTFWCLYCKLMRKEWQAKDHEDGELWTLQDLINQAKHNKDNNLDGTGRMGVREDPYFNFLMKYIIWPLLHALIGIGNNLLQYIVEFGDCEIQCLPRSEYKLIQETKQLEFDLANARENKKDWEKTYKPVVKTLERKLAQLADWIEQNKDDTDGITLRQCEMKVVLDELEPLNLEINAIKKVIAVNAPKVKSNKEKLKEFNKARKNQEDSVCTGIDNILKEHNIRRAAYHGGDLQGTCIIQFMAESDLILNKIEELFLRSRDAARCKYTEDQIKVICNEFALTLTIWDYVFATSQRTNLKADDLVELQKHIELGMELIRKMGLSVTSKFHGMDKHLVPQIGNIRGGIGKKFEYWMEKYHQDGAKLDMQHRMTKSMDALARLRLKRQSISCLPEVQQKIQQKREQHTRGKRKGTAEKEEAVRLAKKERRDVLSRMMKDRGTADG